MALPMVVIVGRPNVGKSSLLNTLARRRISIVDPTAGVTRDRIQVLCEHNGCYFELVDTGGFGVVDRDDLGDQIEQQIRYAVEQASLILFVVDAREGIVPLDSAVASWLRACGRPVFLLANKVDAPTTRTELGELHRLGFGPPMAISALQSHGVRDLVERIVEQVGALAEGETPPDPVMKVAIVGRRNVGKSTFVNALAGQERVIVSERPGTTRDAVDVCVERDGRVYLAIDTAGLQRKSRIADDIGYYSFHRAQCSIRRADVVLFLIDATAEVSEVDKKLGAYIVGQFKPCILVVNKWDLAKDRASSEDYGQYLLKTLPGLEHAPVAFTTASRGKNVQSVLDLATELFKQSHARVATAALNAAVAAACAEGAPKPKRGGGQIKVYYATQVGVAPPTIVVFVNHPSRVDAIFERFLLRRLHDSLCFTEVPIRLVFRGRHRTEGLEHQSPRRPKTTQPGGKP